MKAYGHNITRVEIPLSSVYGVGILQIICKMSLFISIYLSHFSLCIFK